jgi:hypothetical protein
MSASIFISGLKVPNDLQCAKNVLVNGPGSLARLPQINGGTLLVRVGRVEWNRSVDNWTERGAADCGLDPDIERVVHDEVEYEPLHFAQFDFHLGTLGVVIGSDRRPEHNPTVADHARHILARLEMLLKSAGLDNRRLRSHRSCLYSCCSLFAVGLPTSASKLRKIEVMHQARLDRLAFSESRIWGMDISQIRSAPKPKTHRPSAVAPVAFAYCFVHPPTIERLSVERID